MTLPKEWRDQYATKYFISEIKGDSLVLKPLLKDDLGENVETAWKEYQKGDYVTSEQLMEKYGL